MEGMIIFLALYQLQILRQIRERFWDTRDYITHGIYGLLSIRIDLLDKQNRFLFLKLIEKVRNYNEKINEDLEAVLREFAHSPMLDPESKDKAHAKERRDFLKANKVIFPDQKLPSLKQAESKKRSAKKKKKKS